LARHSPRHTVVSALELNHRLPDAEALSQMFGDGGADQCYSLKSGRALLD
jgi:hypothetical protein